MLTLQKKENWSIVVALVGLSVITIFIGQSINIFFKIAILDKKKSIC